MEETLIRLPRTLIDLWKSSEQEETPIDERVEQEIVLSLVRRHRITASRGAELLRMPYQSFLDLMARNEIPLLDYSPEELRSEVEGLRKLRRMS